VDLLQRFLEAKEENPEIIDRAGVLVNFSFFVLITDASPHCSNIMLQWIARNIGKLVRYVAPSHHHHDHD
jgi:hypothetical protein